MARPKVCILRTAGTNCDVETAYAFEKAGGAPELVHVNRLIAGEKALRRYQILAVPGGFSYGDDAGAGRILANELRYKLTSELGRFCGEGKLIIGICNGFQVLVKSGLLPGNGEFKQEASLIINDSGKFEDRWVYLKPHVASGKSQARCVWTAGLPEVITLPVAHGEGKFVARDKAVVRRLRAKGQVVFRYCDARGFPAGYPYNPNGSEDHVAGICDESGRILGLMPHPERHIDVFQHPRKEAQNIRYEGDGLKIFRNGVAYAQKYL